MFKKKTFSEIWEDIKIKEAKKNTEILAIQDRKNKEVENLINAQYKQALETIGDKLTITKQHNSMFRFCFGGNDLGYNTVTLFGSHAEPNGTYELYHYAPVSNRALEKFKVNIKLKELGQRLIQYTRLVLKTKGIIV